MDITAGSIPAPVAVMKVALSNSLSGHNQDQLGVFPPCPCMLLLNGHQRMTSLAISLGIF